VNETAAAPMRASNGEKPARLPLRQNPFSNFDVVSFMGSTTLTPVPMSGGRHRNEWVV